MMAQECNKFQSVIGGLEEEEKNQTVLEIHHF